MNEIVFIVKDFTISVLEDENLSKKILEAFNDDTQTGCVNDNDDSYYQLDIKRDEKGHCLLWFVPSNHYWKGGDCEAYTYNDDREDCIGAFPWHIVPGTPSYLVSQFCKGYEGKHFTVQEIGKGLKGFKGDAEIDDRIYDKGIGQLICGSRRENVDALYPIRIIETEEMA